MKSLIRRNVSSGWIYVLLTFVSVFPEVARAQFLYPPSDENIVYMGRWDLRDPNVALTVYSGSGIRFGFNAGTCVLRFDTSYYVDVDHPTLSYRIDDGEWIDWTIEPTLILNVEPGVPHSVEIVVKAFLVAKNRWRPPLLSVVAFQGIALSGGGTLLPGRKPAGPKIEVFGDSITEGILIEEYDGFSNVAQLSDARRTYGYIAAMHYDADLRYCVLSGQGILIYGNGEVPRARNTFGYVYLGVEKDDRKPDTVIIHLGENDSHHNGREFELAYKSYINIIRSDYPNAEIFCMLPFRGFHEEPIQNVVSQRQAEGDSAIFYIDTRGWLHASGTTDGRHPTVETHAMLAERLIEAIELNRPTAIPHFMLY